jgi:hypothetical protein
VTYHLVGFRGLSGDNLPVFARSGGVVWIDEGRLKELGNGVYATPFPHTAAVYSAGKANCKMVALGAREAPATSVKVAAAFTFDRIPAADKANYEKCDLIQHDTEFKYSPEFCAKKVAGKNTMQVLATFDLDRNCDLLAADRVPADPH